MIEPKREQIFELSKCVSPGVENVAEIPRSAFFSGPLTSTSRGSGLSRELSCANSFLRVTFAQVPQRPLAGSELREDNPSREHPVHGERDGEIPVASAGKAERSGHLAHTRSALDSQETGARGFPTTPITGRRHRRGLRIGQR